jgi:hypothetical protein
MSLSWSTVTALNDSQADHAAATIATVDIFVVDSATSPHQSISGPLSLERFGSTNLFRLVVHNADMTRNKAVLCLPPDCLWRGERPRKVKSRRSGMKAVEVNVVLPQGHKEGYDRLCITAPYDGEDGRAMLLASALIWASQEVLAGAGESNWSIPK